MQVKTFLGKYRVRTGEQEFLQSYLLAANSSDAAWNLLDQVCQQQYGDGSAEKDGDEYIFDYGSIAVCPMSLTEIGLSTFIEMRQCFPGVAADNVEFPTAAMFDAPLQEQAQQLTNALNRKDKVVGHSQVLNAIASVFGHKNWQVFVAKTKAATAPAVATVDTLRS